MSFLQKILHVSIGNEVSTETLFLTFLHEFLNQFAQLKSEFCTNMIHIHT